VRAALGLDEEPTRGDRQLDDRVRRDRAGLGVAEAAGT
jgi:hypothetical protein